MATSKKRRGKKASGGPIDADVIDIPEEVLPEDTSIRVNPLTGGVEIDNPDGSVTIDPTGSSLWAEPEEKDESFGANLADQIDPTERGRIAEDLLMKIDTDKQGRSQWEQMRAKTVELLGLKLEDPKGDVSRSALGMSTSVVRDPTLLQAVEFFRANAYGELCPAAGPVKVVNWDDEESEEDGDLAELLQKDLNYYMTTGAPEYYPDMYHMLWWTGVASGTFKKVYKCPLRGRPVSEFVDGTKIIVPTTATDLKNSPRVTHEVEMDHATMRAMQLAKVYRDIPLGEPLPIQISPLTAKKAAIEGKDPNQQLPEDQNYTLYECYAKLNIKGLEHTDAGKETGLPLPYVVTIDTTSREILALRRNWDEEDDDKIFRPAQIPIILFPFSTGLSRIYGSGLGQMMGNMASALTALLRISIDGGILGNYPGFVKQKGSGRDLTNEIMVPPGGAVEIDTGGARIQDYLMPVPYKDASPAVMQLMDQTRNAAKELGGTANVPVAEGKQDAPVGTTLAMIEQAAKPAAATHKMLWAAQAEEFRQLVKLFRDDPESLWAENKRPAFGDAKTEEAKAARLEKFKRALDNCNITPMADPNVPSEMHRKLLALFLKQMTAGNPAYDQVEVDRYIARNVLKMPAADFNKFLAPPQAMAPPPDPKLLTAQAAVQNAQTNAIKVQQQGQIAQATLQSKEQTEAAKLALGHVTAMASGGPVEPAPPDPMQIKALELKEQQIQDNRAKMAMQFHADHQDRESKTTIKAMDIAARLATHPESQDTVNAELQGLSEFLTPPGSAGPANGARDGGAIGHPLDDEAEKQIKLALLISQALQERQQLGYTQH